MGVFDLNYGDIANQPLGGKRKSPAPQGIAAPIIPVHSNPAHAAMRQTVDDGAGGVYTPGGGAIAPDKSGTGILSGITNFFKDSAQAARTGVHYDDVKANRQAAESVSVKPDAVSPQPANSTTASPANFKQDPFGATPDAMGVKPSIDGKMMTGQAHYDASGLNKAGMAAPDSSGGGFTAPGGTSYNVKKTSQDGIMKITATGKNPLYTNINPEDAVAGLNNQMIGGDAASVQQGIDRHARANAITQSLIDKQPKGGFAVLPDYQPPQQGMSISDLQSAMKSAGTRTERAAYGQLLQTALAGQNQLAQEQLRQQGIAQGLGVQMRGQDIAAASESNRLSIDEPYRRAKTSGQEQQNRSAGVVADLQQRAISGDAKAIETLRAINGKSTQATDRFMSVQGGEEIGPDGMTKIKRPGGVFDAQTGQFVPMNPQQGGQSPGGPTYEQFAAQMNQRYPGKVTDAQLKEAYAKQFGSK